MSVVLVKLDPRQQEFIIIMIIMITPVYKIIDKIKHRKSKTDSCDKSTSNQEIDGILN